MEESGSRLEVGGSRVGVGADGALAANPSATLNLPSALDSPHSSAWLAWCYLVWFCFLRQARRARWCGSRWRY